MITYAIVLLIILLVLGTIRGWWTKLRRWYHYDCTRCGTPLRIVSLPHSDDVSYYCPKCSPDEVNFI